MHLTNKSYLEAYLMTAEFSEAFESLIRAVKNGHSFRKNGLTVIRLLVSDLISLGYFLDGKDHPPYIVREIEQALQDISGYIGEIIRYSLHPPFGQDNSIY